MNASEGVNSPKATTEVEQQPVEAPAAVADQLANSCSNGASSTAKPRVFKMSDEFLMFKFKVRRRSTFWTRFYMLPVTSCVDSMMLAPRGSTQLHLASNQRGTQACCAAVAVLLWFAVQIEMCSRKDR